MPERRELEFNSWDEVRSDLDALAAGYEQSGNWNLEQAAKHLEDWIRYPIVGFPKAPLPLRVIFAVVRTLIGKSMLKKMIAEKRMRDGLPTAPETAYEATSAEEESEAIAQLRDAIDRFEKHAGEIHSSPIYGAMDKQTCEQLQFVHFAHHLSWLTPTS